MNQTMPLAQLMRLVVTRVVMFFVFLGLFLFLPAGTWKFW